MPSSARVVLGALLLAACGAQRPAVAGAAAGYQADGLASWYGDEAAGQRTASGLPFDPDGVTAAHRTLPLGSWARVTSLDTGRSVTVRVIDRGPGRTDRLIDLSRGAAMRLGTDRQALARVRVRAVTTPADSDAVAVAPVSRPMVMPDRVAGGGYAVRVASFTSAARAQALAAVLSANVVPAGGVYRVTAGPYPDAATAQRARDAVAARGYGDAVILPAP